VTVSASSARIFSSIAGKKTRQTRGDVDQVAAQMLLQNYLDSRAQQNAAGGFIKELD
jgi:RNase H-fold protein (predicted Holliday junction resolvase)